MAQDGSTCALKAAFACHAATIPFVAWDRVNVLAYKLNEQLALALGEMEFKYEWDKRQLTLLPLGIELNYIADLWDQKTQFFVNPQYNFESTSSNSSWTVFVGFTLLVPEA